MARRFRDSFYKLLPSWLTEGEGELVAWSLSRILDAFDTRAREGLTARFPSTAGDSALALIGQDRGIFRGRSEPREHYVERLKGWRWPRGHRVRGNSFALLEQVSEYWGGIFVQIHDRNQNLRERAADGTESYSYGVPWNWDGAPASRWARFWLVLHPVPEVPAIRPWPRCGDGMWGGGTMAEIAARRVTVGQQGVTVDDCDSMRRLFKPPAWKPAGTSTYYAVVDLEDRTVGSPTPIDPDGTWDTPQGRANAPDVLRFWRVKP